jgi:hypothetical protein
MFLMPMGGEKYEKAVAKENEVNQKVTSYLDYVEREAADRGEKLNIATSVFDVVKNGELNRLPQALGYNIGNTLLQMVPTAMTGGYSMFADTYASAYKKGVDDLAKRLNITPDQVIEKGLDAKLVPVISASIQSYLEKLKLGIIGRSIASTGGYAAVRNWLIKNVGNSKWGRYIGELGALGVAGVKEGATELGQEATAVVGEIGAKSQSLKDFMQQLPEVASKENQDRYAQAFVEGGIGGTGVTVLGKGANAALNRAARAMAPAPAAAPQPPPAPPKPGEAPPSGASKKSTVTTVKAPEGDTYYENVTDEEFEAYKKGQIDADRLAGITDDANIATRNPKYLLELQDDPNYHMMVVDKMHELHEEKKSRDISDDELAQFQQTREITPERIAVIQNDIAQGKDLEDFDSNYQELVKGYLEEQAKSLNPEADDSQNVTGVSGEVGGGQAVVEAQPIEGAGAAPIEAGGVVQAQGEQIIPPSEEVIIPGQTAPPQAGAVAPEAGVPSLTAEQAVAAPKVGVAPEAQVSVAEQKPTPRVQEFLGKKTNVYENYVPSPENVEPDAVYSFTADSKENLPELLQDRAQRASKITTEVGGKKVTKEKWTATIPGDELGKIYEKQNEKLQGTSAEARKEGGPQAAEQGVPEPKKAKGREVKLMAKAKSIEMPWNMEVVALQAVIKNGVSSNVIKSLLKGEGERRARIGYINNTKGFKSIDAIAEHVASTMAEMSGDPNKMAQDFDTYAIKSAVEDAILSNNSKAQMARKILDIAGEEEADMMRNYDPDAVYEEDYNEDLADQAEDIVNNLTDADFDKMYSMSNADFDKMVAMFAEEEATAEQKEAGKILSEAQEKLDKAKEALAEEKKKQSNGNQQELFGRTPLGFAQNVSPKALEEKITQLQTAVDLAQREVDKAKKLVESEEGKETRQAKMEFEKSVFSELDAAMELSGQQSADARKAFQEKHGKDVYDNAKKITKEFEGIVNYLKDKGKLTSPCL